MKKPKQPLIELTYEDAENCDRCGSSEAMDFGGELLCKQCVYDDVFNDYNEKETV